MSLYQKFIKVLKFNDVEEPQGTRFIWKNIPPPIEYIEEKASCKSNRVKTSRYEIWNFLVLCFIEQLKKLTNIYFILLIIIMLAMGDRSPVSPITTILPLLFVFLVSFSKQGYEDYNRHKSDNIVNSRIVNVLVADQFIGTVSEKIRLGDIVMTSCDEEFPCDMVLLASSTPNKTCYITTVNFDGETNLKLRYCVSATSNFMFNHEFQDLQCAIEYDVPNHDLNRFHGKFTLKNGSEAQDIQLTNDNFLMRGSLLKNTEFVIGIAVFIGKETKLALNQQKKRKKFSIVDKKLNHFIVLMIVILVVGSALITLMHYFVSNTQTLWYIDKKWTNDTPTEVFIDIFSFVGLLNHIIPISLSVTLEIIKFFNSFFIDWDLDMYAIEYDESARSNSSDTIEELGQIEYIFTDKTGTLTQNIMLFKQCIIKDVVYEKKGDYLQSDFLYDSINMDENALEFWTYVAICHEAEAVLKSDASAPRPTYRYMSASADEVALLEAAASLGIMFKTKEMDILMVEINTVVRNFKIMHVLPFDPIRKRMSVLCQNDNHEYYLICKGADSSVVPISVKSEYNQKIVHYVDEFAKEGYRTLVYAYKKLTDEQYFVTANILHQAQICVSNHEEALQEAYMKVESDLSLIGSTAVDDKLQDGVISTLRDLRLAGIKIWVLTGDKLETAVSISRKCGHLSEKMQCLFLIEHANNVGDVVSDHLSRIQQSPQSEFALVIDGSTLKIMLADLPIALCTLFKRCNSVICCRMSPLQKSKIIHIMRKTLPKEPITLAIGDGANDCSMIQEAHVGVGLVGREGRQAAYCSDYSLHHFRFLKNLVLFHGFNCYTRIVNTIMYFFYKNFIFCMAMFLYTWYTNFSPSTLFNDVEITMYNTLVTSLPVIVYGTFEQIYKKRTLLNNPAIYKTIAKNSTMKWRVLIFWLLNAIWQSMVIFYWGMYIYNQGMINIPYHYFTYVLFGTLVYTYIVICVTIQIQLNTRFWTLHSVTCTVGSLIYFSICEVLIALIYTFNSTSPVFASRFSSYYVFFNMLAYPHFWCGLFIVIPIAFFPFLIITYTMQYFFHDVHY